MKAYKKIIFMLAIGATLASCDANLEKDNPNNLTVETYYTNDAELVTAVNAVYAVLQDQRMMSREWFFTHDLRSDDMATGGGQLETPRAQLLNGNGDASNFVSNSLFQGCYGLIHRANAIIEKAPKAKVNDQKVHNRVVGEAKFLRAMAYFELVSLWGGVPLYTETVKALSDAKPRAAAADVYNDIIGNLKDAATSLDSVYNGGDKGRATKFAAEMLLARVYMQRGNPGDYASAQTLLEDIVHSGLYSLTANYNDNFMEETEYNSESVFEVGFKDSNGAFSWGYNNGDGLGQETTVHNQEINPTTWGNLIPSLKLLKDFEPNDPRFGFSFYKKGDAIFGGKIGDDKDGYRFNIAGTVWAPGDTQKIGWRKHTILYKSVQSYYPSGNNERIMRYAEVLLMLAECQNETGTGDPVATLNLVRDRASVQMPHYGTPAMDAKYPVPAGDKVSILKAIAHEKRVELAGEEIRNRDILRWRAQGKLTGSTGIYATDPIPYYAPKYALLPIPQVTLDSNPKIGQANQNPGY